MRALSLTQPWAWLVVHGGKDIENRTWNTRFRGRFLIHAAKGMTSDQHDDAILFALDVDPTIVVPSPRDLERGGIVGVADLVDVLTPKGQRYGWHMHGQFGFVLHNVQPLPFLPCKGALGFWGNFELRDGIVVSSEVGA